uniref:Alternative protein ADRBK2 n=1 Tax=Homo sapiens TaxID=9606 RepID=L8EAE0_HUMAN|nr:alternative protein ADRBK2 [Homo sapiens]
MGAHWFSFFVIFKYDFSTKLLEVSLLCHHSCKVLMPLIGPFTDVTISGPMFKKKGLAGHDGSRL